MKFNKKEPLIILIAGKAESGKSSLAEYLKIKYQNRNKKVIISPYSKYLKYYIEDITSTEISKNNKPRDMLQQLSSKIIKGEMNKKDFFITRQLEDISVYSYFADVIIVPDVRFINEIEIIKNKYKTVVSIGVIRPNHTSKLTIEQQKDETETALDDYHDYDYEIINNETTNLEQISEELIIKIKENNQYE